ncbi:MAG: AraC family transcriptional regulator [Bacteroidales bacterium]|nr:AraC family transcriptional regulator [Bacteroidales bacterium]
MLSEIILERVSLRDVALICPMIISLGWAIPNLFAFRKKDVSNRIMGIFMLNMFVFFLATNSLYFSSYKVFLLFDPFFMFALTAIFPILFLYLKAIIASEQKLVRKDIYHFVPSLLFFLSSLILYNLVLSSTQKHFYVFHCLLQGSKPSAEIQAIVLVNLLNKLVFFLQALIYLFVFGRLIKNHRSRLKDYYSNLESLSIKWTYLFFGAYLLSVIVGIPVVFGGHRSFQEQEIPVSIGFLILSSVLYLIVWVDASQKMTPGFKHMPESAISSAHIYFDVNKLKENLLLFFQNEKPYLNADLKVEDVQYALNTNRTYISQLINKEFNTNFCMFVNRYRIREAKQLLTRKENTHLTNEYIGKMAGFGTYHSFIQAFRYFENTTPANYRKGKVQKLDLQQS